MLSHKNFVNMISMLSSVLEMDITDGILSVLPMHHTFEFSAGFLTPFSNGTQITYFNELSSEELSRAIENSHVTGMVGVPALWEMLHRRIKTRLRERGDWFADLADNVIEFQRLDTRQHAVQSRTDRVFPDSSGNGRTRCAI